MRGLPTPLDVNSLVALADRFHERHEAVHGHAARDAVIEIVSYRLRVVVPIQKAQLNLMGGPNKDKKTAQVEQRTFRDSLGNAVTAGVWRRDNFPVGEIVSGPIIVEQLDSTAVVPKGWGAALDKAGNLLLHVEKQS
tara:strand:- start:1466 stop:1876 length:411 start_codon:yes stop_codon:yes gene_type:complete